MLVRHGIRTELTACRALATKAALEEDMADDEGTARRTSKATKAPKKAAPKKAAANAPAVKQAPATRVAVRKGGAEKAVAAKGVTKRQVAKKSGNRATAAETSTTGRSVAKKAGSGARPAARAPGAVLAGREKQPPPLRLAAEQTFDDDPWEAPVPEPVREDPAARVRGLLRAAALSLEEKNRPPAASAPAVAKPPPPVPVPVPASPPPAPSPAPDQPITRVLVAPIVEEPELEASELEAERELEEDEGEWSPPEVLDDAPPPPRPRPPSPPPPPPPPLPEPDIEALIAPPPPAAEATPKRGGAGLSVVAIVAALVVPLFGAIAGFVLARRARRRGAALAGVARVVSVLALVGWLVGAGVFGFVALRDEGIDYSKLKVGDCFDSSQSNEVRGVKVKSCSEPHNSEIFFLVTHPAGPGEAYPGKDQLVQFAADACLGQPLTDYLGIPLEQSMLKDFEIVPQESAWEDGRRLLVCGIDTGGQGDITGSVMGTRR